mgnify:FL=1
MCRKTNEPTKRKKGKDKMIERKQRNGKYSSKHIRCYEKAMENRKKANHFI